jgi:CheY-like chemotaxis protein
MWELTRRIMPRALIVDDNRPLAENLAEILSGEGYEVLVCDRPEAAMSACERDEFDVALLDVRMPGMDGVELHRALAVRAPRAHFVLMTAYSEDARIAAALAAGVRAVLPKPIPIRMLLDVLRPVHAGGSR